MFTSKGVDMEADDEQEVEDGAEEENEPTGFDARSDTSSLNPESLNKEAEEDKPDPTPSILELELELAWELVAVRSKWERKLEKRALGERCSVSSISTPEAG